VLSLGRRAIDLAVLFLALYALAFVPLGRRTGLEHLRAILRTRAARDAGRDLLEAAERLRHRLLDSDEPINARGAPVMPALPRKAPPNAAARTSGEGPPDASL